MFYYFVVYLGLVMRQLFELEKVELKEVVDTLIEAVRLSSLHAQDLRLVRQRTPSLISYSAGMA